MKLIIDLAGEAEDVAENVNRLLQWFEDHGIYSEGEVLRIGPPHGATVFAWRIAGIKAEG